MSILNYQQSHLDLNKVESINKTQLVDLMNNFTISYMEKLKSLMVDVDSRLYKLNSKIITCQSNLCILEARIASVPGLNSNEFKHLKEDIKNLKEELKDDIKNLKEELKDVKGDLKDSRNEFRVRQDGEETGEESSADKNDELDEQTKSELIKYKKMIAVGVPREAVGLKMKAEGFDPNLLK